MLENIKALMQVREHIEGIKRNAVQNRDSIISLSQEIESFREQFNEVKENQEQVISSLKEWLGSIKELKEELKKELYEFKLLKSELQRKILEKFEAEIRGSIAAELEKLRNDVSSYNQLKEKVEATAAKAGRAMEEMERLVQVIQSIDKKDFEMERFAKQLLEMDREKLELMRKIDGLERLVAGMRRNQ